MARPRTPVKPPMALWRRVLPHQLPSGDWCERFESPLRGLMVLSGYYDAESPKRNVCPHFHISVSHRDGRLPTDVEMRLVRHDFDMKDAEEDNHDRYLKKVHGVVRRTRQLWLPEPAEERGLCPCADDDDQALIEAEGTPIVLEGGARG